MAHAVVLAGERRRLDLSRLPSARTTLARLNGPQLPAVVLTLFFTLANLAWVVRDHTTPSWDQSHYLYLTWVYRYDLDHYGIHRMVHDIYTIDPGRGQGLSLLMIPIAYFTNGGPATGLILNIILWPILLLSSGAIAAHFYGERARVLAVIIVAPMPELVSLSHTVLQDFLLVTMTTLAIWLLLRTEGYTRFGPSVGLGFAITVGTMTKISFGLVLAIPMLLVLGARLRTLRQMRRDIPASFAGRVRRSVSCLIVMALCGGVIPVIWYVQNWAATRAYLHEAFMKQPGTLDHPTSIHNLGAFAIDMINEGVSWQIMLVALLTILLLISGVRLSGHTVTKDSLFRIAFLGSFALVPFLAVAVSTNHGVRYAVATMPACGIILAGLISHLRLQWMRYATSALVVIAAITMTMQVESSRWRLPGLADSYHINTSFGPAYVQLARGLGPAYNYLPSDYAADMLDYLASVSKNAQGVVQPRTIAILELQGYVNGNSMPYEAALRGLPFTFVTLFSDGSATQTAALTAQLRAVNFALYLTQPKADLQSALGRVAELNNTAAANHMTSAMFALFEPRPHGVYVGEDSGQGNTMYVLVRRH